MAVSTSLPALLDSLTKSLTSTNAIGNSVAKVEHNDQGISLLDVKNELLISYLQHLVLLVLSKSRNARKNKKNGQPFDDAPIVEKLVELRLYLEKGVRPLEDKLRYQIDKVLRAASSAEANATAVNGPKESVTAGSETDEDDDNDNDDDSDKSGSEAGSDSDEEVGSGTEEPNSMLAPRLAAFVRQTRSEQRDAKVAAAKKGSASATATAEEKAEVYKPSKTRRVLMPEDDRKQRGDRKKTHRSRTMEEYLEDEFSTAPSALPSIGTTIADRGRRIKTAAERKIEEERREYEETNFTRLPKESKKQRKQRLQSEGRSGKMSFGGEEWRELGEGLDRIERLTKRKGGSGSRALLEKSRKRAHDSGAGGRGPEMGERFQKRLKVLEGGRRDKGGRR
ncbi:hypothetical protein TD95_003041 [Thielaviopsis punctulata]|uniref:Sas10 C-terminal domain-containing protein n=1 Tax=Thielaviopsis punctulata TaxID=72032 RepID=A0A0F4ZE92_9PEZI|nr:hypothetical protein TD95_003041 [Thielaviopsis punctulata]